MKVVCAGGGSGGHVTPVLAVINELKRRDPHLKTWFITERGFAPQARNIMARADTEVSVKLIPAGKIRRYFGIPMWRQLLHIPMQLLNLRDFFLLLIGCIISLAFLLKTRPDVVFTKGGFVCVPVGIAAKILGIPLVIHDSDTHPGLTNRLLARWASSIATGAPLENYSYPASISQHVGIPVDKSYRPVTPEAQKRLKNKLGYPEELPMVLVTGGGLGAQRINNLIAQKVDSLEINTQIVHVTGTKHLESVKKAIGKRPNYEILAFIDKDLPDYVRAADLVVTRAGATTLLELAAAAKPVIIIPHPNLPGAHQIKNARVYANAGAATVLSEEELEEQPDLLPDTIDWLLQDAEARDNLSANIHTLTKPHAASEVAKLIRNCVKK